MCRLIQWLPAFKAEAARMLRQRGWKLKEIASFLGVSEAYVSMLLRKQRGKSEVPERLRQNFRKALEKGLGFQEAVCFACRLC